MSLLTKQCRRKAEADGLVSLMNDTKWREMCLAFSSFEPKPAWRTLDLLNGYLSDWDRDWFHHVGPEYCSIQWLEIDSGVCDAESVKTVLSGLGVPFEKVGGFFRILGYRK